MGGLVMTKNEGRLDFLDESIRFISESGGILKAEEFVAKVQRVHPDLDITSCYHKIIMARYFGLILFNSYSSYYFLTESGSKYSRATSKEGKIDAILNAMTSVTFGRNNNAVSSDSDIEAPVVMLKTIAILGAASMTQIGLILYYMDTKEKSLSEAISEVLKCEEPSKLRRKLVENKKSKYFDVKFNKLFEDLEIVTKEKDNYILGQYVKENHLEFISSLLEIKPSVSEVDKSSTNSIFDYELTKGDGINKILYGVPGCGKSYHIENVVLKDYKNENKIRTTFYQDYSNTDFVGQILPKIIKDESGNDIVEYIFNPGPFTLALIQAISNPTEKVALIVEEISRGNAPAIFGDIFQLLDRNDDHISEYGIVNVSMLDYLNDYVFDVDGEKKKYIFKEIKIPGNMYIYATMNTSDQNVYTLDTAFTRRWEKERIKNDFNNNEIKDYYVPGMSQYTWEEFVNSINGQIQNKLDDLQVNEDKQVGAFFVKKSDLLATANEETEKAKATAFAYKVLEYLWDDVSKLDHSVIFNPNYKTFEQVVEDYLKNGVSVFNNEIFTKKSSQEQTNESSN